MKKFKVKNIYATHYDLAKHRDGLSGKLNLVKKWSKNDIVKCVVTTESGYEYIIEENNLVEIKTKSNKKNKK